MSQYYVLVRINIVRQPFIQHPDIIPTTYPPEHSPISPPISPPIFPQQPIFPRNDLNFVIIGVFTSRARAVSYYSRQDRLQFDRYRIFGPFQLNYGTNEQYPDFYMN
ncbi:uncharacterized protein METZ01_LOCUS270075 [marine metagenome]|uniref:Uncharacterized protein n=1 Tax=marine metagenome TaxID=408172 RepID=A0A382K3H8_9ZZZZ|tara:strand:- start:2525 stop:2845 length:321 start_codon:yes stop_codon:yes gene_type:complete